ncbi:hypothetical protein [Microtetraspora sp. NBRC 16547]|uniref:hypothetical protein n=1 Tax=Microtetraspora sp. NBRC 16547 TaxID=3030993 RepID=UPI0024A01EC3|nr:hypothetical protein [Microtetraspora sp. NBRC 16547]GLW98759.1 hypothetical protein Misp02_28460 [Microtetraspora sp. NBRC 16547]
MILAQPQDTALAQRIAPAVSAAAASTLRREAARQHVLGFQGPDKRQLPHGASRHAVHRSEQYGEKKLVAVVAFNTKAG